MAALGLWRGWAFSSCNRGAPLVVCGGPSLVVCGGSPLVVCGGPSLVVVWWPLLLWSVVSRPRRFPRLQQAGSVVEAHRLRTVWTLAVGRRGPSVGGMWAP